MLSDLSHASSPLIDVICPSGEGKLIVVSPRCKPRNQIYVLWKARLLTRYAGFDIDLPQTGAQGNVLIGHNVDMCMCVCAHVRTRADSIPYNIDAVFYPSLLMSYEFFLHLHVLKKKKLQINKRGNLSRSILSIPISNSLNLVRGETAETKRHVASR